MGHFFLLGVTNDIGGVIYGFHIVVLFFYQIMHFNAPKSLCQKVYLY